MTKGDLDGVTFLGRPVKPLALQFAVLMATLMVYNIVDKGAFGNLMLGDVVAVMAVTSAACLTAAWVMRSQRMAEVGLLLACIVYVTRSAFLLLATGWQAQGVWLGLGAAIGAGGAFLLETWDGHETVGT